MRRIHPHFYYFRKMANVIELTCPGIVYTHLVCCTDTSFTYKLQVFVHKKIFFMLLILLLLLLVLLSLLWLMLIAYIAVAILSPTPILIRICARDVSIHLWCLLWNLTQIVWVVFFSCSFVPYFYCYLVNELSEKFDLANWLVLEFTKGVPFLCDHHGKSWAADSSHTKQIFYENDWIPFTALCVLSKIW